MNKSSSKALVETSAVRAKVGPSTPEHMQAFDRATASYTLYTSCYVRMEFVRRWICTFSEMAITVARFDKVAAALVYLEQSFSPREVKAYIACIAELESSGISLTSDSAAEEFARSAFHWLRRFDRLFPSRIQNRSHCRRGNKVLDISSFANILDELASFTKSFRSPVTDCEVNRFLKLSNTKSEAYSLANKIAEKDVSCMKSLLKYVNQNTHITCTECERIGDVVIALEQTRSFTLAHIDNSFSYLCTARGMPNLQIPSLRAADKNERTEIG